MARPGYMFLVCPDAELLHAHTAEILEQSNATNFEKKVYWADEELPATFWDDLTLNTLFGSDKVVILRMAHKLKAAMWDTLDKAISSLSSSSFLLLCLEGSWDKKKKAPIPAVVKRRNCFKFAEKKKWIWEFGGLNDSTITDYINKWAIETGIKLDRPLIQDLAKRLPKDARAAKLELAKLELAASDDNILKKQHLDLISYEEEMDFFVFMNSMSQGGDPVEIWRRVLTNHQETNSLIFLLTASLTREARSLWMLTHGEDSAVRMPPFVKKQKQGLANKLGPLKIARLFDMALEAEMGIKTGQRRPDQALELLVANLTTLFSPPRPARR